MRVIDFHAGPFEAIREFESVGAAARHLAVGAGASHAWVIHLEPGSEIGPHEAGFDQLLLPIDGTGWAAGADGVPHPIVVGAAAAFRRGELHSEGSEEGMTALLLQVERIEVGE